MKEISHKLEEGPSELYRSRRYGVLSSAIVEAMVSKVGIENARKSIHSRFGLGKINYDRVHLVDVAEDLESFVINMAGCAELGITLDEAKLKEDFAAVKKPKPMQ